MSGLLDLIMVTQLLTSWAVVRVGSNLSKAPLTRLVSLIRPQA